MNLKATKTPLLIAAMATAITLTTFAPVSAKTYWISAEPESAQIVDANFKVKVKKHHAFKKHKSHHVKPYKGHHGVKKKKKHLSKHDFKKKLLFKKLF